MVLLFFALLSLFHVRRSFGVYESAKMLRDSVFLERAYVDRQLEDLRAYALRREYDFEQTGRVRPESLRKIEIRGADLSPENNRPFSESEVEFAIIEQE